jgi:hypothetical protein
VLIRVHSWIDFLARKLRSYARLSPRERRLAIRTISLVALVRLGLWLLPFRTLQRWCEALARPKQAATAETREIVWAIRLASRYVPCSTCLVQSLAAQILLARHGLESQVHIGVARDQERGFRAHAWVQSQGKVIVGDMEELGQFAPMMVLDPDLPKNT